MKEIIEEGNWTGVLTGQGLEEGEVVKLFMVEGRPEPEEEVVEHDGEDWTRGV